MSKQHPAYESVSFADLLNEASQDICRWSIDKGFWESVSVGTPEQDEWIRRAQKSQKLMLIVSELSEALEAIRKPGETPSKIPGFTNEAEEIADAMIRLLDYAGRYNLRIGDAVAAKMAINENRPHKHGKAF